MKSLLKCVFVDLDGTIIQTQSGANFPKYPGDWKLVPKVVDLLHARKEEGYKIILVTNQAGIFMGHGTLDGIERKIQDIQEAMKLSFDITIIAPSFTSPYRKPKVKALSQDLVKLFPNQDLDLGNSLMIGDAGGRDSDFSDSDLKFAENLGVRFVHVRDL